MKRKLILTSLLILVLVATLVTGCTGEQGVKGSKGATGEQGIEGEQGETGSQGIQGEEGEPGPKGSTGARGASGSTGTQGTQGIQGEQGLVGPAGAGYPGATGATGATGPQGPPGSTVAPTFSMSLEVTGNASALLFTQPVAVGTYSVRLQTAGNVGTGQEARIVITPLTLMTLSELTSISWSTYTSTGSYPPHVDITIDCDGDGVVDLEDMLTAEMAYNNFQGAELDSIPSLTTHITYGQWLQTFELSSGDGFGAVTDSTMLWVTQMGAGNDDAPWGTLADWKNGLVVNNPGGDPLVANVIDGDALVVKVEIEIDNWVLQSEAFIDNITINGILVWQ